MRRIARHILLFICLLGGTILFLGACGAVPATAQPAAPFTGFFGGQVATTSAALALVSNGKGLIAYICDGTSQGITIAQWFSGSLRKNSATVLIPLANSRGAERTWTGLL